MAYCEQCDNESMYSVGEIGLCEPCYKEYCEEHLDYEEDENSNGSTNI